jgi:hypothetical protein
LIGLQVKPIHVVADREFASPKLANANVMGKVIRKYSKHHQQQ